MKSVSQKYICHTPFWQVLGTTDRSLPGQHYIRFSKSNNVLNVWQILGPFSVSFSFQDLLVLEGHSTLCLHILFY